ncbi:hypothetical protein DEA8626_02802 [Defluviimonas aquaemixtae]|uniref:Uncharacterized protein n=1 Tax=Albidovulum aquaemixtae TaxID=1542388 RepID=A0A2R8BK99_9RHOB|nr:hypothetical protein [Defluviimonas aquaemixtae]SPH23733.1 hypothetical protein DEA8626_02802 [Defluviimonas aquaemixtae]
MKVHILDDWFDILRHLPSFARLDGHDVTVWNDRVEDAGTLSARLREADPRDPLASYPRVIATPHIGYATEDEFDLQFADIYDQINAFADGAPINVINSEALER